MRLGATSTRQHETREDKPRIPDMRGSSEPDNTCLGHKVPPPKQVNQSARGGRAGVSAAGCLVADEVSVHEGLGRHDWLLLLAEVRKKQ